MKCTQCKEEFKQVNKEKVCSPTCRLERTKENNRTNSRLLSQRNKARKEAAPKGVCFICQAEFIQKNKANVICRSLECIAEKRIIDNANRSIDKPDLKQQKEYYNAFTPSKDITKFGYIKLLRSLTAKELASQAYDNNRNPKLAKANATMAIRKLIANMDRSSLEYRVITLEREYIRKYEEELLRANIRLRLSQQEGGDYSLEDTGKVLGITRERVRQIEVAAIRLLKRPNVASNLRPYLEYDDGDKE